jgi:2-polyprenyl-3-methyl-5-hydroxy-6-metoxy-1,4-benzoquinol methylase
MVYENLIDPLFGAPGSWTMKRCEDSECGLLWLDPCPHPGDLHLAYKNYFTHQDARGKPGFAIRFREFLYAIYRMASAFPANFTGLQASKNRLKHMYLDDQTPGKLLDVGCGDGQFLALMQSKGWTVDGVDFDSRAIENAKVRYGLELKKGELQEISFPKDTFTAVTLKHVIEHVPEPVALLVEVRRILKPGGRLVITTPNAESLGHEVFGRFWFGLDSPRHLQIFSPKTLSRLAANASFKIGTSTSTAANADIFIGASSLIRSEASHQVNHYPRPNFNRTVQALRGQYREHSLLRTDNTKGEEVVLIANK